MLRELLGWSDGNFPTGSLTLTLQDISKGAGLHRNTVQRRIQALREGGVLEGYLYEPRPAWMGLIRAGHLFDGTDVRDTTHLAELLAPFPFISIAALHAEACFIHSWHESEDEMRSDVKGVQEALGAASCNASFVSSRMPPHPSDSLTLTALDRRIILALRRGFDRSLARIATEVGVSRRTVARRVERLARAEAGALLPMLRPARIEGAVIAIYDSIAATRETPTSLRTAFPDRIMGPMGGGVRPMALVPVASVDEASRRAVEARDLPGLAHIRLFLLRDWIFPVACDKWLATRVQNAPPPSAKE